MTWLSPMLGIVAASIAVPTLVILYFLKLRRRDVEISTTLLWKKSIQDLQANAPFQRLRRNILLLLQLLALGAALTALAQPQIRSAMATGQKHLILIDRSASMNATDGAAGSRAERVSRLEAAKAEAIRLVDSLREPGIFDQVGGGEGDQAMVIAFDTTAKVLQSFTGDKALLRSAIRAIEPSDSPSSIDEAIRLALAQAPRDVVIETRPDGTESRYERPPKPVGTIHIYSDGRLPDVGRVDAGREEDMRFHSIGTAEATNIGITSLRAGRAFDNPSELSIFVGLQTTERSPRTVDVELRLNGEVASIRPVELPSATIEETGERKGRMAPGVGGTVFRLERPEGAIVAVRVSAPATDELSTDNAAFLVAPPAKRLSVAVVTRGNLFLSAALENLPLARLDTLTPEQFEQARADGKATVYDVVVLDGYLPTTPKDAATPLPAGRYLVLGAVPGTPAGLVDKGKLGPAVMVDWSKTHPALRGISLDALNIGASRPVEIPPTSAATVLAAADNGPAIVELTTPEARAIVVGFDVAESDWPFDVSFVVFMAQAVEHLGDDGAGVAQSVQPGGVYAGRLPRGSAEVRVRLPDGATAPAGDPAPDGTVVFGPLQRVGVYQMSWRGEPGPSDGKSGDRAVRPFAANLLDAAESDIGAVGTLELARQRVSAEADSRGKTVRSLWPWLLLAALGVLLLEWFIYNRKVQV
ncbi:MAG: BatA and WFA domain-containing protein [Phycisphaerae bacterium]|nr:BatA and WFA domain-containing protein [Phycisphaerae bacterium]